MSVRARPATIEHHANPMPRHEARHAAASRAIARHPGFRSPGARALGLTEQVRHRNVAALNRLLAHTMALCDLYRKAHWQTSGATFYGLHLLFEKHYGEQEQLMDALAERVQTLGGVARALARDIAEETLLARGPSGVESSVDQPQRLADAHEFLLQEARPLAREAAAAGDDGSEGRVQMCARQSERGPIQLPLFALDRQLSGSEIRTGNVDHGSRPVAPSGTTPGLASSSLGPATRARDHLLAPRRRPAAALRARRLSVAQRSFSTSSSLTGGARLPQALRR
jgi:starvation-inducible DNA-binding protein